MYENSILILIVVTQSINHFRSFLDKLFLLAFFRLNEKKGYIIPDHTKKLKIIVQFLSLRSVVKSLKD